MRRPIWAISLSSVFPGLPGVLCQAFNLSSRFTTPSKICRRAQNKQGGRQHNKSSLNLLSHLAAAQGDRLSGRPGRAGQEPVQSQRDTHTRAVTATGHTCHWPNRCFFNWGVCWFSDSLRVRDRWFCFSSEGDRCHMTLLLFSWTVEIQWSLTTQWLHCKTLLRNYALVFKHT